MLQCRLSQSYAVCAQLAEGHHWAGPRRDEKLMAHSQGAEAEAEAHTLQARHQEPELRINT